MGRHRKGKKDMGRMLLWRRGIKGFEARQAGGSERVSGAFWRHPCLEKEQSSRIWPFVVSAGAALGKTIAVCISAFFARL
jgi:hypothetical protein